MDPRGDRPETGRHQPPFSWGIAGMALVLHWLARAFSRRDRGAATEGQDPWRDIDTIIARRAERLHNRDRAGANAFIRAHTILSRGKP
jgi:hypothetical protein